MLSKCPSHPFLRGTLRAALRGVPGASSPSLRLFLGSSAPSSGASPLPSATSCLSLQVARSRRTRPGPGPHRPASPAPALGSCAH